MNDVFLLLSFLYTPLSWILWCYQAVQITHMLSERKSELAEAEREKALKDITNDIA